MPFDAATTDAALTERRLYLERREAAARLWETVPTENFDLSFWHMQVPLVQLGEPLTDRGPCRTIACALGWLGELGHDGWRVVNGRPYHPLVDVAPKLVSVRLREFEDSLRIYETAACYFGLQVEIAGYLFGDVAWYRVVRDVLTRPLILRDVAEALLDAPVTLDRDRVSYTPVSGSSLILASVGC